MVSVARSGAGTRVIRPMNPFRDWGAVAHLMRVVFQSDVSAASLPVFPDWAWLNWLRPLVALFGSLGLEPPEQMLGYVWEDEGRIIGNVTLGLSDAQHGTWLLSNVGVHPDYRRQGIARALVETAANETRRHGGRYLTLQVDSDNSAARRLYETMGFDTLERISEFVGLSVPAWPSFAHGWRLQPPQREQWAVVRSMTTAHLPRPLWACKHSLSGYFRVSANLGLLDEFVDLLRGLRPAEWCLLRDGAVIGGMVAQAQVSWGMNRVVIHVLPEARAEVEELLVGQAMAHLQRYAPRRTQFIASADHAALFEILRRHDFREGRTLDLMALKL
jgi:ribosomal protein S18 acetylase RimI-like enzyme